MNAAFLLVTSACLMGQATEIRTAPTPPITSAPIVASSCGPNCGSSCDSGCGCESYRQKLCDRLRGMFKKGCNDSCQPTTCHTHHQRQTCQTCQTTTCDTCQPKIHHWKHKCHNQCAPANTCDTCSQGGGFLSKLKALCHRKNSCCDGGTSCGSSCANGACAPSIITTPATSGEPINAPKKMPAVPANPAPKKQQEVRIENQPAPFTSAPPAPTVIPPSASPAIPVAPSVEITPVPAPRVDGDRRDPF